MAAMLHARNNTILFLRDKMFILMQNIFIVPSMQHGHLDTEAVYIELRYLSEVIHQGKRWCLCGLKFFKALAFDAVRQLSFNSQCILVPGHRAGKRAPSLNGSA